MMCALQMDSLTPADFRKVMSRFATGVTVVSVARENGEAKGMTANSFTSVSLEPMLVLVCVDCRARTHPLLEVAGHFGVSILSEHQQAAAEFFAAQDPDPASMARLGIRYRRAKNGTPLVEGALAEMVCRRIAAHPAGDHTIFIGEVEQVDFREGRPLLFYGGRYRSFGEESA
jgi:flavin reductase (DIM6/NTAB) family NADH-FMN oxidoreductase RutF